MVDRVMAVMQGGRAVRMGVSLAGGVELARVKMVIILLIATPVQTMIVEEGAYLPERSTTLPPARPARAGVGRTSMLPWKSLLTQHFKIPKPSVCITN